MHLGPDLLVLGVLFVIAYVLGRLGKSIGLPAIPIYMVVGLLASPYFGWFPINFVHGDYIELIAVFGLILLLFNLGLGVLSRLMPQMQVFFVGMPVSILVGLIILLVVLGAMMSTFLGSVEDVLHALAPHG